MTTIFIYISTVLFLFLSVIWNKNDWVNFFVKILFIIMFLYGCLLTTLSFGFVVQV